MVSTFIRNDDEHNQSTMKVTIVSVLPFGMEHHATTTAAPYQVEGRPVVHHTIRIPNVKGKAPNHLNKESDGNHRETEAVDWTVYPTAVIHRLHKNFGLFPQSNDENTKSPDSGHGGHIFIAMSSNLPPASGLSTSSAIVTGLFLQLDSHLCLKNSIGYRHAIGEEGDDGTVYNLSTYLGNVENGRDYIKGSFVLEGTVQGGVGTFGGSEDHAAILMGKQNELRLLSFCPTRPASFDMEKIAIDAISPGIIGGKSIHEPLEPSNQESVVPFSSDDLAFVIAYSGAKAEKAGGADGATEASVGYNTASDLARKAFDAYIAGGNNQNVEGVQTLADAIKWERAVATSNKPSIKACMSRRIKAGAFSPDGIDDSNREEYYTELVQRFAQFYDESEYLVPSAAHAISKQSYDALGPIVDASHRNAVNLLKNQIEETAWLPLWARGIENDIRTRPLSVVCANPEVLMNHSTSLEARSQPQRIRALAASAFGAGFGGSCWALVHRHLACDFAQQWSNAYEDRFPTKENNSGLTREFFVTEPGPGAFCM